mmetsp:Transcript_10849/g.39813  ORF Transcript_10849/g.39813 Transcript_10849/m.39813 type:complete len:116 (-) Transcript_10849:1171-1518(-)
MPVTVREQVLLGQCVLHVPGPSHAVRPRDTHDFQQLHEQRSLHSGRPSVANTLGEAPQESRCHMCCQWHAHRQYCWVRSKLVFLSPLSPKGERMHVLLCSPLLTCAPIIQPFVVA